MSIVSFSNITKSYGATKVFEGLSVTFHPSQHVGLIGPNGSGKTTLFRMILGTERPDTGTLAVQKNVKVGYLPQEPEFVGNKSVIEVMHEGMEDLIHKQRRLESLSEKIGTLSGVALKQSMAEYDRLAHELELEGGWSKEVRIRGILHGLGLGEEVLHAPISTLSGGQLSRLGLARVLLKEADLLLLDEPTNHLDLHAVCWLETFLKNFPSAVILISHDRFLLNQLVQRVVEIEHGKAISYNGNYTQYCQQKMRLHLQRKREQEKRRLFVRKTLDFIARNKDQEGMRKTARGRKKRLERLLSENPDFLEKEKADKTISMRFRGTVKRSEKIIRTDSISKSFGDLLLFRNLSLELPRGGRVAVTGPNGSGKSTLLKILLGDLSPDDGVVERGTNLTYGYLDQHANTLDPEHTVLEEAAAVRPDLALEALRGRLGAFLFRGEQAFQRVRTLSGGQKNRLMLCKLVLSEPDVLILDEPTNHLDIESCEVLEGALERYSGSLITVSHDRFFLDRSFDTLLVMGLQPTGQKSIGHIEWVHKNSGAGGVYSSWSLKVQSTIAEQESQNESKKNPPKRAAPKSKTPREIRWFNKYTLVDLEHMILYMEEEIGELEESFGKESTYKNPEIIQSLKENIGLKKEELALLYKAYEFRKQK